MNIKMFYHKMLNYISPNQVTILLTRFTNNVNVQIFARCSLQRTEHVHKNCLILIIV